MPLWFIGIAGWLFASFIYLPWWWRGLKGEKAQLSKAELLQVLGGYGLFAAMIGLVSLFGD